MKQIDTLRTRVRDMLFGRTKIKVINQSVNEEVLPVFLIGTFRSGTTLFRYLLDSHSRLCCPPETKFLVHLAAMREAASTAEAFEHLGFDESFVRHQMRSFANGIYGTHLGAMNKEVLIDKTPEYVRILPFLDWLYEGKCKYVLIFRNGLDVAHSMYSTHIEPIEDGKTIDSAFEYWKTDTQIMLNWMNEHPDRCHKVVYNKLCDQTEETLRQVMAFSGLEFESGQLNWYDHEHSRGAEDIKARRQRKINKSVHNYREWPDSTVLDLKQRSAELHTAIGYDPDSLLFDGE